MVLKVEGDLRRKLVDFLATLSVLATDAGRRYILRNAGLSDLISRIDLSPGAVNLVMGNIVDFLANHGTVEGQEALERFLSELQYEVGEEHQNVLKAFILQLSQKKKALPRIWVPTPRPVSLDKTAQIVKPSKPTLDWFVQRAEMHALVLFTGRDLPRAVTGLPSNHELAQGLQAGSESLAAAAQNEPQWRYTQYFKQQLGNGARDSWYQTLASLPLWFFITTTYDTYLTRALKSAGRRPNVIFETHDLGARVPGQPDVIKLCGGLEQPHTLAVTEDAYKQLRQDAARLGVLEQAGEWLREKTTLLVGCDPQVDSDFETWIYWEILYQKDIFRAGAYLVWPSPAPEDVARWAERGVILIDAEPEDFLTSLSTQLADVSILPPDDVEQAKLREMLNLLRGTSPTQAAVNGAVAQLSVTKQPRAIHTAFRLWLSETDILQCILDVDYTPSVLHYHGQPYNTGVSLQDLHTWAKEAEDARQAWDSLHGGVVEQRGVSFFDRVLPVASSARQAYRDALRDAQLLKASLCTVLEIQDPRLASVPWELLHDGHVSKGRGFLGRKYPLYRLPDAISSFEQVTGHIEKALLVAADPTRQLAGLNDEVTWLAQQLRALGITVDARDAQHPEVNNLETIKDLIRDGEYQLLHFAGHGQFYPRAPSQSKLLLGLGGERGKHLTAASLAAVARESDLVLVFLSACEGGMAAESPPPPWREAGLADALTRAGVPATVAMRWLVGTGNSRTIAKAFYAELLQDNESPERALMTARQALPVDQADWANPVLTKHHGVLEQ